MQTFLTCVLGALPSSIQVEFSEQVIQSPLCDFQQVFGSSFTLEDIDRDGFDDLVVFEMGATVKDVKEAGRGWVLYGPEFERHQLLESTDPSKKEYLGGFCTPQVPSIGDVNADGYADVLVPAPRYSLDGLDSVGRAHLFFGPDFEVQQTFLDPIPAPGAGFGYSVLLMDLTGDGRDDIVVGGPEFFGPPGFSTGKVVIWDSHELERPYEVLMPRDIGSATSYPAFGASIDRGDIDGDGVDELLVAAPQLLILGEGRGYVFAYSAPGLQPVKMVGTPEPPIDPVYFQFDMIFGFGDVIYVGDLSGDSIPDMLATAPTTFHGGQGNDATNGLVVRVDGPDFEYSDSIPPPVFHGDKEFGEASSVGDFDLDGHIDVLAGDPESEDSEGDDNGETYIFWGPDFDTYHSLRPDELFIQPNYGLVNGVGDSDGDGWPEAYVHWDGEGSGFKGRVNRYELITLKASASTLARGESVQIDIALGVARAQRQFLALPSVSGQWPGHALQPGVRIALNPDPLSEALAVTGWLDDAGAGSFEFAMPDLAWPGLAGRTVTFAALALNDSAPPTPASNTVSIELLSE